MVANCFEAYVQAPDALRRIYNQSLFDRIYVGEEVVEGIDLELPFAHLLAHDLVERLEHETAALSNPDPSAYLRQKPIDRTQRPKGALPGEDKNRNLFFFGHGSNVSCLVGLTGQNANHLHGLRKRIVPDTERLELVRRPGAIGRYVRVPRLGGGLGWPRMSRRRRFVFVSDHRRLVVVTGAAGGIGLGIGRAFGSMGDSVVLVDIDRDRLQLAERDLAQAGIDAHVRECDVRHAESMSDLASWVVGAFGRVDIVCLNVGGPVPRSSAEVTEEDWERDLALNLFSVVRGVTAFLPAMEQQGHGHINATSSMSGLVPFPPVVTYNVAKAGVIAYMETVARELADRASPVTVSVLCPGEVATRGVGNAMLRAISEGHQPSVHEQSIADAAQVSLLEGGMNPDAVGRVLVQGIEAGRFWIFTHSDWVEGPLKRLHEAMTDDGNLADL